MTLPCIRREVAPSSRDANRYYQDDEQDDNAGEGSSRALARPYQNGYLPRSQRNRKEETLKAFHRHQCRNGDRRRLIPISRDDADSAQCLRFYQFYRFELRSFLVDMFDTRVRRMGLQKVEHSEPGLHMIVVQLNEEGPREEWSQLEYLVWRHCVWGKIFERRSDYRVLVRFWPFDEAKANAVAAEAAAAAADAVAPLAEVEVEDTQNLAQSTISTDPAAHSVVAPVAVMVPHSTVGQGALAGVSDVSQQQQVAQYPGPMFDVPNGTSTFQQYDMVPGPLFDARGLYIDPGLLEAPPYGDFTGEGFDFQ